MAMFEKLNGLSERTKQSRYAERIICQLKYATELSTVHENVYDALIEQVMDRLLADSDAQGGVITKDMCMDAERMLMPLSEEAKRYRVYCVAHAHIDMNWMWGYQETASLTVDTFRTVLDLMKEYPDWTFGQSQASAYRIIEEYAPEMLQEIRERIAQGRWEVTASTWVETDKNMPGGEALARHILYTGRYLSALLDISADSLNLDFEPDTFGHALTVPEICRQGGVKYYYHCRGNGGGDVAYRWRAKSGAELLTWREPAWYNFEIHGDIFRDVPQICAKYGINCYLAVYGVGDHGGGPTRRDITRLKEIASWPIMPEILFGTYGQFFAELERHRDRLPVYEGELNCVFTGCYSSQSRIKMANRVGEDRMYESEYFAAAAHVLADSPRRNRSFADAWERLLFNQFHDILPGSGVTDTREYAMGQFQAAMAGIQTNGNLAMRSLADAIDTASILCETDSDSRAEGSGAGYRTDWGSGFAMPQTERGMGRRRIFHLFNSTPYDFDGVTELTVWDWNYDGALARFRTPEGESAACELRAAKGGYWGHQYKKYAVLVQVPAFGYATYILEPQEKGDCRYAPDLQYNVGMRFHGHGDDDFVMENNCIRAVFDHRTMQMVSLVDKKTGIENISAPTAYFRFIRENTARGMTSWNVGDYMTVDNLNEVCAVHVNDVRLTGLSKEIGYRLSFGAESQLQVSVGLDENSSVLQFKVGVDYREIYTPDAIPQLNFHVPVGYGVSDYRYGIPVGSIDRPPIAHDVPGNIFCAALPREGGRPVMMLMSDSKYGFRGWEQSMALTLLRASGDPDPYPEYGMHNIRIGLGVTENASAGALDRRVQHFVHGISACSARPGAGTLPMKGQLMAVEGNACISAVKTPEDFDGLVIRFYVPDDTEGRVRLVFAKAIRGAYLADINERNMEELSFEADILCVAAEPYALKTVIVKF